MIILTILGTLAVIAFAVFALWKWVPPFSGEELEPGEEGCPICNDRD